MSASTKVEGYIRAESRLSQVDKPPQFEDETKAQYCWRLIRHCVKYAVDVVNKANARDVLVVHGIHHTRTINHVSQIHQLLYNDVTKECLILDGKTIRVFREDGRKKEIVKPQEPFNRLIHVKQMKMFIGWTYNHHEMLLMTSDFEGVSLSEAHGPILAAVSNESIGEVVTVGPGFLTSWVFRYGGRHLLPRKTTTEGLKEEDRFSLLVLEGTASRTQKAFAACGTSVAVFNLYEGQLLTYQHELHTRTITSMLFFNPLKYLVTGARDGSIKVWDDNWHLQLVFVGHTAAVSALAVYPYGPMIMSGSYDNTIRVWSLETCDEVDSVETSEAVEGLCTMVNMDKFSSLSDSHIDLWRVQHVHTLHSTIGYKVFNMKSTDHPAFPVRSVLLCKDASIRILSPTSGDIITTLLMSPQRRLVDAAYAIAENTMFAVYEGGDIIKCNTSTNPCKILGKWKCKDPSKACNYLMVYEYVITSDIEADTWAGMKRAIATKGFGGGKNANRTLLLGGRKDGRICVFDWETGKVEFEIEAHGSKGVLNMIANSKSDQLISAGLDNIIKIWRLYPYAQESLAPLMSFYCAHTPVYMTVMRSKLSVAFQEHTTATYSVVMYNLETKSRHDHGPEEDHMDSITGLCSCPKMKLLASSSIDGTIHVWNEVNNTVRKIRLNATPNSICFCSQKGDLLVGIGQHIHKIDYKNYMPQAYRFKMVSMPFPRVMVEKALPFNENILNTMSKEDVRRLKAARSSFKFMHFVDVLTDAETEEVMREQRFKEAAFSQLDKREEELAKIRDGELKPKRKPKSTAATKRTAFEKYLKIFYDRPKIKLYEENPFPDDEAKEKLKGKPKEEVKPYKVEREPTGFFPAPSAAVQTKEEDADETDVPPIKADCFIPNSVMVRLLWPKEVIEEAKKEEPFVPPQLTAAQMEQIAAMNKKRTDSSDRDQPMFLDYEDEEEKKDSEDLDQPKETPATKKDAQEPQSNFMQKMQDLMKKPPTPPAEPSPLSPRPDGTSKQEDAGTVTPAPQPPKKPREIKPLKPIVKFKSKPPTPPPSIPSIPSPPPPREPTPPRPVTPLPNFITQFIGQEWFDKHFPGCNENTIPKPWTVAAFVSMLLKTMHVANYPHKVDIINAIKSLHSDEGFPNLEAVHRAILTVLGDRQDPPSCLDPDQKAFIMAAIQLIHAIGIWDRDFYLELMAQFLDADQEVRKIVMSLFHACGLKDPQGYFPKELDTWDVWGLEDKDRGRQIRRMCRDWLEKWLTSFKMHLEDSIERLKKGQNVHGRVHPGQLQRPKAATPKSILKKPDVDSITETEEDDPRKMEGVQFIPAPSKAAATPEPTKSMVTVTFDSPPDAAAVDNATYIEGINYFCDMTLEKELEKLRNLTKSQRSAEGKNTVLVLPKIDRKPALVRLGETHTSKCRPHRETAFYADLKLPPVTTRGHPPAPGQLYYFPPAINLPLKTVYMNPFPSPLDEIELLSQQPLLLTLKTSQKYFVPSRSVVPQDLY